MDGVLGSLPDEGPHAGPEQADGRQGAAEDQHGFHDPFLELAASLDPEDLGDADHPPALAADGDGSQERNTLLSDHVPYAVDDAASGHTHPEERADTVHIVMQRYPRQPGQAS